MNIVVAQSGGPTSVINASLLGVYRQALQSEEIETVFGSLNGIEGIIQDKLVVLNNHIRTQEDMMLVRQTPSSLLNSCRYKLPEAEKAPSVYETILATLRRHNIGAFFYIGGNDSMDTVDKLSSYFKRQGSNIRVMGIPKTIDNDLMCTDHTPGYGSAAKHVATSLLEIIRDCTVYDLDSVTIVEIMGRDTGWLTAAASVLRANGETAPHLIYLPEAPFSTERFLNDIHRLHQTTRTVVVAISEGVTIASDEISGDYMSGSVDNFGHKYLSGIGKFLETLVRQRLGCKVRSVELNILQRCAAHLASETDLNEAEQAGAEAVKAALSGETGKVIVFKRDSNAPYSLRMEWEDVHSIANQVKYFPSQWITDDGNNVTDEALRYILPLIQGEPTILTENGLPRHFRLPK